jgi:hypothetical protein
MSYYNENKPEFLSTSCGSLVTPWVRFENFNKACDEIDRLRGLNKQYRETIIQLLEVASLFEYTRGADGAKMSRAREQAKKLIESDMFKLNEKEN